MKTWFAAAAVSVGMLMAVSSGAYARDCAAEAQAAVDAASNPAGAALVGCGIGAGLGAIFGKTGGAAVGGCALGGASGVILSAAERDRIYNNAYASCTNGGAASIPASYTTYPAPAPSAVATSGDPSVSLLNVRVGPGTDYGVSEKLPVGTTVNVSVCSNTGWCQVGGYQGPGWMSMSLLHFN